VWRLADGTPLAPALHLAESVGAVAVHGDVIVTAAGRNIAVHQPAPSTSALRSRRFPGTTASQT
jgi:hypothetical protein